jgi:inosose dehydratase
MTIRFGVSPIAWINDDMPELGGDTPLENVLAEIQAIGFGGVELGGAFPRDAGVLRPLLQRYRLDLVGGWYGSQLLVRSVEDEWKALAAHLALLKAMGSTVFICAETSNAIHGQRSRALSAAPRLDEEAWKRFGERLSRLAERIAAEGLRFAYHHHLGTVVERGPDLDAFLRHTSPAVGLTLDTGHAALAGIDPVAVLRAHPGRIAHVHCKDVRRTVFDAVRGADRSFLDGVLEGMFTAPGDGDLDYAAVMRALKASGYDGWIIVEAEQDPARAEPRRYQQLGLDTLRSRAREAGLVAR